MVTEVRGLIESALADPWSALRTVLDGPLHPGGRAATAGLLDRAAVGTDTRLLDVGCGAGEAMAAARDRGTDVIGIDRDPARSAGGEAGAEGKPGSEGRPGSGRVPRSETVRGDLMKLPLAAGSVDVVLGECVFCLAPDYARALGEARRVLRPGGRIALSDIVVGGEPPDLPDPIARTLCLERARSRAATVAAVSDAGFAVDEVRDHREDLLSMRDEIGAAIDYERLLPLMGERGEALLDGIEELETATETGRVSYVSLVATAAE